MAVALKISKVAICSVSCQEHVDVRGCLLLRTGSFGRLIE